MRQNPSDPSNPDIHNSQPATNVTMADVLSLPDAQRTLVTWMMRQGDVHLDAVATFLSGTPEEAHAILLGLEGGGFVEELHDGDDETFRARAPGRRNRTVGTDIWRALADSSGS